MRRKLLLSALAAGGLLVAAAPVGLAQPGGLPDAVGSLARAFGLEVSGTARAVPAVLDDPSEVSPSVARAGGMPLMAEMTGEEFGTMVSELARSAPGAAADYFRGLTPSAAADAPGRARDRAGADPESSGRPTRPDVATERRGAGRP